MRPEFKINQLKHFIWVAELKGFHAAAEKAHRSQPAISLSIKDLEYKLGAALFEKNVNTSRTIKTELTPLGLYFLPKAKELVAFHDRLAHDIKLLITHQKGHLRLASVPSIASLFLPQLLLDFIGQTHLHVSVFDDSSVAVLAMVDKQQVDFGISGSLTTFEQVDKQFIPIWQDDLGVVCAIDHPLTKNKHVKWTQLKEYSYISNGTSKLLEDSIAQSLLHHSQYHISNMISLIAMLEARLGITTLPWYAYPKQNHQLTFIPLLIPKIQRQIGIVFLKNKSLAPSAQAFIDFILEKHPILD